MMCVERTDLLRAWWKSVLHRQPASRGRKESPMIVATDIAEVHEIMTDTLRQRVMIISETQMHVAPWLHAEEGWQDSRLRWAVDAVCAGQVRETDLAYEVQGDTARYTIPKGALHRCPCPAAHYGSSHHCKH